jgi:tetratricopeptide (TPR) repeat protein
VKSLEQATTHFRRAIELDPSYAAPHAGLADAYTLRVVGYGFAATDSFSTAKTMALRAVELNETLAEGHTALGFVHLCFDWDPDAAERSFRRAIDLNPSLAQAHQWLAQVHIARANDREALVAVRRALELDPLSVVTTCEAGWPLSFMGEHAQAAEQFRRALAMDPDFGLAHYNLANTHEELGEVEDAIAAYERAVSLTGGAAFAIARLVRLLASTGRLEEAERYANDVRERAERGETIQAWLASVLDSLGRVDDAVAAFERAIDAREPYVFFAKWRPASYAMTNMPRHPRFPELLSRIRPTESQS